MASGTSAPAGVALVEAPTWFDGPVTVTNTGGSLTLNGPVTYNGAPTFGGVVINDLTSAVSPSSAGLKDWTFPYALATQGASSTGSAVTVGGRLYLAKIPLSGGTVVTNIWFSIATAAATPTTGRNFAGLYNSAGKLVATSADLTTAIGTNTGAIQAPLTAAYTVPSGGGNYWVGIFFNASTLPVLSCYANQVTVTTSVANLGSATTFGNVAATYPFSVSATGSLTTALPASITMSSNTATGAYALWAAIN